MSEPITFIIETAIGWVCSTPDSDGPFVIGPFTDRSEANVWLENISQHLAEDLTVFGPTMIWTPVSFTDGQIKTRAVQKRDGQLTIMPRGLQDS